MSKFRRLLVLAATSSVLWWSPGVAQAVTGSSHLVAVVVDFADGTHPTLVGCIRAPAGASDAQALDDLLHARGVAASRYSASGLLCAIGDVPATGCGTQTVTGYQYWAYFHGSAAGWSYADDGPAERISSATISAGFRFEVDGKGNAADPSPTTASNPHVLCAGQKVVSAPTTSHPPSPSSQSWRSPALVGGGALLLVGGALLWRRAQR